MVIPCRRPNPSDAALRGRTHDQPSRHRISLRKTDLARDQRRRRAGQGLHRALRRRRAARAAPAARRRSGLSRAGSPAAPAEQIPDKMLVLPIVAYGYTGHVMDFPGTINNDFEHFMHHVLDITKSLAYHGFKKIILLNGHGSNMPNLDLVARRTNLETDAECVLAALVEPADGRQGIPAALAAEQVPRRLRARLRAGDVAVSVPRRRQRPQGPDQERHDQLQRGEQPVQLGRPVRRRPGDGDLVDQQLFRDRRAGRGRAGHGREGPRRPTRRRSSSSCGSSPGSRTGPRTCAATATASRRPCRCPGASGRSTPARPRRSN